MPDLLKDADLGLPPGHHASVRHVMLTALKDVEVAGQPIDLDTAQAIVDRCHGALKAARLLPSDGIAAPHPDTIAAATVLARRLCRDDALAMEWGDALAEEVRRVRAAVDGMPSPKGFDAQYRNTVLRLTVDATHKLACMLGVCARWGTPLAVEAALSTVRSMAFRAEAMNGLVFLIEMRDLPACIGFYAMLVGATDRGDRAMIRAIMNNPYARSGKTDAFIILLPMQAIITDQAGWSFIEDYGGRRLHHSEPLFRILQPVFGALNFDAGRGLPLFDRVEATVSLEFAARRLARMDQRPNLWFFAPSGEYMLRRHDPSQLQMLAGDQEAIGAGLFGGTAETAKRAAAQLMVTAKESGLFF